MRGSRLEGERGSLPMVMLATIVVTGLVVVLLGSTITGQRQARFDQGFEQSLQIAEVGLDRLVYLAESGQLVGSPDLAFNNVFVGGGTYTATATQTGGDAWVLTSTGVAPDGTERTVTLTARPVPFFNVGFFADEAFQAGGTTTLGMVDDEDVDAGMDGVGGTNDIVHFNGYPSMPIGALLLANWAANNDPTRCTYNGAEVVECDDEDLFSHQDDMYEIINDARDRILQDVADGCVTLTDTQITSLNPGDYCASTPITFGNPFTVSGSGEVRLLLTGTGKIQLADAAGGHSNRRINWTGEAYQFQIYSTDAIEVDIRSNSKAKALIYAPNASCYGRGEVEFHGAMMCRTIDTGGNSTYFVPEDILNVTIDNHMTIDWRESNP